MGKWTDGTVSRRELLRRAAAGALAIGVGPSLLRPLSALAEAGAPRAWSFGVMADTQWTCPTDPSGRNPATVAVSIIDQVNRRFIDAGVKFVIQVGDLTNEGRDDAIAQRAASARALYDAGIGFFPMRGNHETYSRVPNGYGVPAFRRSFPQTRGEGRTFGARALSSPTSVSADLDGMSYSFDYGPAGAAARFVVIDDWATPSRRTGTNAYRYGYTISEQQPWIGSRLSASGVEHRFVLAHQPLIAESHQDCLFGLHTDVDPAEQNAFFAGLRDSNVALYLSGHDHIHERSLITSPDGASTVEQLICASDSSKFYTPKPADNPGWHGQKVREKSLAQEMYTIGYYIVTVDGAHVTVDYWSDDHGHWRSDAAYPAPGFPNQVTPDLHFVKKASWVCGTQTAALPKRRALAGLRA